MIRPRTIEDRRKRIKYCKYCNRTAYYYDEDNDEYLCKGGSKEKCRDWHLHQDVSTQLCSYCNNAPAVTYFATARKYCCDHTWNRCPYFRDNLKRKANERNKHSRAAVNRREAAEGKHKCKYCGGIAQFWRFPDNFCCEDHARKCPGYHTWSSENKLQLYRDRPELRELQRKIGLEVHNRTSVKEQKRETMTILHRGDCNECLDYQKKYAKGRDKWRKTLKEKKNVDEG